MKLTVRSCLALLTLGSSVAFVACSDDENEGPAAVSGAAGEGAGAVGGGSTSNAGGPSHGGGEGGGEHADASFQCQVLGELCHAADSGSGPASDCHDVGHVGDAEACAAEFDGCMAICTEKEIGPGANDAKCVALGSLCHPAGEVDAAAEACHALGHDGIAGECAEKFDECAELCLAVLETLEEHGAGGAGHAGGQHAGGHHAGGAGGAE